MPARGRRRPALPTVWCQFAATVRLSTLHLTCAPSSSAALLPPLPCRHAASSTTRLRARPPPRAPPPPRHAVPCRWWVVCRSAQLVNPRRPSRRAPSPCVAAQHSLLAMPVVRGPLGTAFLFSMHTLPMACFRPRIARLPDSPGLLLASPVPLRPSSAAQLQEGEAAPRQFGVTIVMMGEDIDPRKLDFANPMRRVCAPSPAWCTPGPWRSVPLPPLRATPLPWQMCDRLHVSLHV